MGRGVALDQVAGVGASVGVANGTSTNPRSKSETWAPSWKEYFREILSPHFRCGLIAVSQFSVSAQAEAADAKPFLGRWDLTLKAPDGESPSWLEVQQQGGELKAQFTGRWGNARPLPKVEVATAASLLSRRRKKKAARPILCSRGN